MSGVSRRIDRFGVVFDEESLVADAGLVAAGTLLGRLGVEAVVDRAVRLGGRAGGARPGRKVLSLVAAMLVGATHIDHADRLRTGAARRVLGFTAMAPSTLGTFLRSFTWGHVRQLDKAAGEVLARAWATGAGPGDAPLDGSAHKAPFGGEGTGPNPTDRGERGWKWSLFCDRAGIPVGWAADGANRHDQTLFEPTFAAAGGVRAGPPYGPLWRGTRGEPPPARPKVSRDVPPVRGGGREDQARRPPMSLSV